LKAKIRERQYTPGFLDLFINPFYFARKGLYQHVASLAPGMGGRLLDVGCGSKPYRRLFNVSEYLGLEMEGRGKDADLYYDGKTFPLKDGEADSVFASQVLEHVFNPDEFMSEINRVLKEGGTLLLTVPFLWDEHEEPFDYARYSSFGLFHLLQRHGLEVIEHRKSMDDLRVIFQMINTYIFKKTITKHGKLNLLLTLALMAPINVLGEVAGRILPRNSSLYLDNIILARKGRCLKQNTV
jgi:SAM-dependent methyltransferase